MDVLLKYFYSSLNILSAFPAPGSWLFHSYAVTTREPSAGGWGHREQAQHLQREGTTALPSPASRPLIVPGTCSIKYCGHCVSPGSALLPDVSAWYLCDRAGGFCGPSGSGPEAERSSPAVCVSWASCLSSLVMCQSLCQSLCQHLVRADRLPAGKLNKHQIDP